MTDGSAAGAAAIEQRGLYDKFIVRRADGRDLPGGDKEGARYFVLDYRHDANARAALLTYAQLALKDNPTFGRDLLRALAEVAAEVEFESSMADGKGADVIALYAFAYQQRWSALVKADMVNWEDVPDDAGEERA